MIAVVDYGLGNLASVRNAFRAAGADILLTSEPGAIEQAAGIVLPGVGAAQAGMDRLRALHLDGVLREVAARGTPLLGLCLGMQLLFDRSEEGKADCLGLIPGRVRLLQGGVKIPQIGWNQVQIRGDAGGDLRQSLFRGFGAEQHMGMPPTPDSAATGSPGEGEREVTRTLPYFYFVHSYVCVPDDPSAVAGTTDYGETFCSAVTRDTIWGTQFHPERSGRTGLHLIRNFVEVCAPV